MSALIVEVCEVLEVKDHPHADRLKLARVKGWWTAIPYDPAIGEAKFKPGDMCVYFPPDTLMSEELADRLGIKKYLASVPDNKSGDGERHYRVLAARLRMVPSYGVIEKPDNPEWQTGKDVSDYYKVTKWAPPENTSEHDADTPHPAFHTFTDIQLWANYPDILKEGEEVVITEKIHGKNCRVGIIRTSPSEGEWTFMAGSHDMRRKEYDSEGQKSYFWLPLTQETKSFLIFLSKKARIGVIAFFEIFGGDFTDMKYGCSEEEKRFRLIDISVDGVYRDYDEKVALSTEFGIDMVPLLYRGPYSTEKIEELTNGPTTLCELQDAGPFRGREGIVITPLKERIAEEISGRAILKCVSADFLARKNARDAR